MRIFAAIGIAATVGLSVSALAQQPTPISCLHGPNESTNQRDRRVTAVRAARLINSFEANGRKPFRPLSMLNGQSPAGWETRLTTDSSTHAFAVKDMTDPCGFALFSDESGQIYLWEAMR